MAPDWATQVSFYRFLANSAVTVERLLDAQAAADEQGAVASHVLALTDTTALDLRWPAGRLLPVTVGPLSGAGQGLLLHFGRCLDVAGGALHSVLVISWLQY